MRAGPGLVRRRDGGERAELLVVEDGEFAQDERLPSLTAHFPAWGPSAMTTRSAVRAPRSGPGHVVVVPPCDPPPYVRQPAPDGVPIGIHDREVGRVEVGMVEPEAQAVDRDAPCRDTEAHLGPGRVHLGLGFGEGRVGKFRIGHFRSALDEASVIGPSSGSVTVVWRPSMVASYDAPVTSGIAPRGGLIQTRTSTVGTGGAYGRNTTQCHVQDPEPR